MSEFYEKCYTILKKVPKGKVTTYKEIARALNSKAYRAVGTAMNRNPYAPIVPCHRVVNSDGKVGGFFSGSSTKIKLLKSEGVYVLNGRLDLKKYFYKLK
jgi:methylated-DNA-[protein]-cysteine S-methyltransferase